MPLYEYECERCQSVFEVMQKFSDEPLTVHENCGGAVHRLISPPALQFKGSGWYITDYAKGKSSGANGSTSKAESKPASESKPAATDSGASSTTKSDSK